MPVAKVKKSNAEPDVSLELGVTNIIDSWITFSGISTPPGAVTVGKDPLSPNIDDLVYMIRKDGYARALFNLLILPIKVAFANGKWVTPTPNEGEQETQYANDMWTTPVTLGGMETSASLFINQALLALPHGFSAFEVVRTVPEEGPLAGKLTIKKMAYRDPRTITFLVDRNGNFTGLHQMTHFAGRFIDVTIKPENSFYFTANEAENPFYGVSLFEGAFGHYQMKRRMYLIWELASKIAAIPGRVGEIPAGATPKQILEFKRAITNMALNNAMTAPAGFKVSAFNGNSNFPFQAGIEHHNTMMATSVLAKFLQQEDRQVLIDNGKADASADMFVQMLESIVSELASAISLKLMPQFMDYNFGTGIYPIFQPAPLTDENKQAILQLFESLVAQPVLNATPELVRNLEIEIANRFGFTTDNPENIDYDKVAAEEEEAAKQQQAQQEQERQAALQAQQAQQTNTEDPSSPPGSGSQRPRQRAIPGGSPSAGPVVKASALEQQEAMTQIASALNVLLSAEDIPEDYSPESEVLPELGE